MNRLYILLLLLLFNAVVADGRRLVVVERGTTKTAPGIGGYAQIGYAFAKGDMITVDATAEKQLERMIVVIHPDQELGRDRATKNPHYRFTMPKSGIVVIRFISDRGGTNTIHYTVTRMPGSDRLQHYNTKVIWRKPPTLHGDLIPVRAGR
jgi:hypothetical protein